MWDGADGTNRCSPSGREPDHGLHQSWGDRKDLPGEQDSFGAGGNGDGQIDSRDAIYSKLVVWIDKNHNGVTDAGELLTLRQVGVEAISLQFTKSSWTDAYGNKFRYRSRLTRAASAVPHEQWVYDVLLTGK